MKKIINRKLYDTATANLIESYENGYLPGDFHYFEERLFQKKSGEFFLHAYGGAMSIYAECVGNGYRGSESIIPMTEEEAQEWCELHASAERYIEIFGAVDE